MTRVVISLILLLHWSQSTAGGDGVFQEPKILWKLKGDSAEMNCTHNKGSSYYQMYWYLQRPGETMRLIVYIVGGSSPDFGDVDQKKFEPVKNSADSGSLTVKDLESKDSAIYFCSVSGGRGSSQAFFGEGTRLTVLDPTIKVSTKEDINVTILTPSEKELCEKKVTLVCVARNFYPDHVKIKWEIGDKEQTNRVATDPHAKKDDTGKFTISSRLKVPIKQWRNPKNKFKCVLNFYNGSQYFDREAEVKAIEGSGYTREDYVNSSQMMKLGYGVLIAKSGLYGIIICVFIFKKSCSGK